MNNEGFVARLAVLAALIIPVIAAQTAQAQVQSEQQQQQEKFFMIIKAQGAVRYKPYNITTNLANTLLPPHNNNSNLKIQYDLKNAEIAVSDSTNSWSIPITIIDTSGDIVTTKSGQISAGLIPFAGGLTKQFNTKTKVTTYTSNGVIEDYLNKIGLRTPEVSIKTTTYPNNTAVIETREGYE